MITSTEDFHGEECIVKEWASISLGGSEFVRKKNMGVWGNKS